jgi:peroxiredoxin
VKPISLSRILCAFLALTVFCGWVSADVGARAPQFTARTLDGQTFNNASLRGSVVLLEFWATRCPDCRRNRAAVDNLARRFSGEGLVVLAVDVGEPATKVRNYLQAHPTSSPVVLDQGRKLSARFGRHGVPYYVLIDRDGYIAGTENGEGGEDSLLSLLSLAGLSLRSDTPRSNTARSNAPRPDTQGGNPLPAASAGVTPPKVIEMPVSPRSEPSKPSPKTIFVLANGERLESDHYTMEKGVLHVAVDGGQRTITLSELDLKATAALNRERGIDLKIPQNRNEVYVAF